MLLMLLVCGYNAPESGHSRLHVLAVCCQRRPGKGHGWHILALPCQAFRRIGQGQFYQILSILKSTRQEIIILMEITIHLFFKIHPNSKKNVGHPDHPLFTSFCFSLKVSSWHFHFVSQDIWRFVVHF